MIEFGQSLMGFLVAIAVLVTVHEYGHFWMARRMGVMVMQFAVGFGRAVWRWQGRDGETEYRVGIIPLGGYIRMLDEREGEVAQELLGRAFNRQSLGARSAVVVAGPVSNLLFAVLVMWVVFVVGSDDAAPVVGEVVTGSVGEQAGFRAGDQLVEVDGREVQTWGQQQLYLLHQAMQGKEVGFEVVGRDGEARQVRVDFSGLEQYSIAGQPVMMQVGVLPPMPPAAVHAVVEGSPAEKAGLQVGDRVLAVNGVAVRDWGELVRAVAGRGGERVMMTVRRGGATLVIDVEVERVVVGEEVRGRVGLYRPPLPVVRLRYGAVEAVGAAVDWNWRMMAVTVRSLGRMAAARMSVDNLSGPITIARIAGHTARAGYDDFLRFLAILSISLGLINLLPVPLLDGGHLLFFAIEAVRGGKPLSAQAMRWGQQVGAVFLVLLVSAALYNDMMRLF